MDAKSKLTMPPLPSFSSLSSSLLPSSPPSSEQKTITHGQLKWFLGGMFIGSLISPVVATLVIGVIALIDNTPIPDFLGGSNAQTLVLTLMKSGMANIRYFTSHDSKKQQ